MLGLGLTPTASDHPCAYTHGRDNTFAVLTLYVNDILPGGANQKVVQRLKKTLMDRFVMTGMDQVSLTLGMAVTGDYDTGTLTISQAKYLQNILT